MEKHVCLPADDQGIIYNVTTHVATPVAAGWLHWMQHHHIPEVMQTACFTGYKIARLLEVDDTEGLTYTVQYFAASMDDYTRYTRLFAAGLRRQTADKWGSHAMAFRTVMAVVQ